MEAGRLGVAARTMTKTRLHHGNETDEVDNARHQWRVAAARAGLTRAQADMRTRGPRLLAWQSPQGSTDRLNPQFAQLAKHYGADVAICPPHRPQRK